MHVHCDWLSRFIAFCREETLAFVVVWKTREKTWQNYLADIAFCIIYSFFSLLRETMCMNVQRSALCNNFQITLVITLASWTQAPFTSSTITLKITIKIYCSSKNNYLLKNSRVQTTTITIKTQEMISLESLPEGFFSSWWTINIDRQSESILLIQAREFKAADASALRKNRWYRSLVWTLISLYL